MFRLCNWAAGVPHRSLIPFSVAGTRVNLPAFVSGVLDSKSSLQVGPKMKRKSLWFLLRKALPCHLNRVGSGPKSKHYLLIFRQAWLSQLFGLIDRHIKPKPPWKNWPISAQAEWDLRIFLPYLLIIQPTHAEVRSFSQEHLNFCGHSLCSTGQGKAC